MTVKNLILPLFYWRIDIRCRKQTTILLKRIEAALLPIRKKEKKRKKDDADADNKQTGKKIITLKSSKSKIIEFLELKYMNTYLTEEQIIHF
jgi:predicted nuclease of restriction endonuclease-like (RecB) superfamily